MVRSILCSKPSTVTQRHQYSGTRKCRELGKWLAKIALPLTHTHIHAHFWWRWETAVVKNRMRERRVIFLRFLLSVPKIMRRSFPFNPSASMVRNANLGDGPEKEREDGNIQTHAWPDITNTLAFCSLITSKRERAERINSWKRTGIMGCAL